MALSVGEKLGPTKSCRLLARAAWAKSTALATRVSIRDVAIKILPHYKTVHLERKRRFMKEARAAPALNYPNIVTLYDIATENGIDYLWSTILQTLTADLFPPAMVGSLAGLLGAAGSLGPMFLSEPLLALLGVSLF